MSDPDLLCIPGSLRAASLNTKLLHEAVRLFGPCDPAFGDLRLPLYDGDLAADGMPESVILLHRQMQVADATLIAVSEYNAGLSGVLKNALDWVSRLSPMPVAGKACGNHVGGSRTGSGVWSQYSLRHGLTPVQSEGSARTKGFHFPGTFGI
ncbi:MAG: NAD(P)H-dependent oxidoreductase [Rhodobacteraceae bacterium]|nr:NAD(P)H-dependent oxidoreductase [Paracoccaceae bacterium]